VLEILSVALPVAVFVALWGTSVSLRMSGRPGLPVAVYAIPIAGLALAGVANAAVIVEAGHVGVVTRFGAVTGVTFEQGLNYKVPFIEGVWIADVRTQKEEVDAAAASRDLQEVKSRIALNYHLDATQADTVYQAIGPLYKQRIVDPAIQEAFKFTTAQFNAEELITQRETVKERAREFLRTRLGNFNVIVEELNIVTFEFSRAFNDAIEAKQVAAQRVLQAENERAKARVDAETRVIAAEGDAQAVLVRAKAASEAQETQRLTLSDLYVQFLAVDKWDGKLPSVTAGGNGAVPFIQLPTPGATSP
jgi:regulator of protease activity HflC (stomatin/prohibitin superfamily)